MGLCKCPKKKVTNQFCFEHRVNVCEYCMVTNHPKCVVQSYLLWLQDSDYSPNCTLCQTELSNDECIRLLCYHVFHWNCLNQYAKQLPSNTAPAGYSCPTCNQEIFPASNVVSPIADNLKQVLTRVNWARAGLGLPLLDEPAQKSFISTSSEERKQSLQFSPNQNLSTSVSSPAIAVVSPVNVASNSTSTPSQQINNQTGNRPYDSLVNIGNDYSMAQSRTDKLSNIASSPRKLFDTTDTFNVKNSSADHDEDKYKRRSAFDWLSRWFKYVYAENVERIISRIVEASVTPNN
ncbi:ZFPL1 (predicted) [Pycnogonum litorale]